MGSPVYFLVRHYEHHFTCIARGISVLCIPELHEYRILRFYPMPTKDLTDRISVLQRVWRKKKTYRKWCSNPRQLFFREQNGIFPSYSTKNSNADNGTLAKQGFASNEE